LRGSTKNTSEKNRNGEEGLTSHSRWLSRGDLYFLLY
jgi:hypothetical protein